MHAGEILVGCTGARLEIPCAPREGAPCSFLPETCASEYLSYLQCFSSQLFLHQYARPPLAIFCEDMIADNSVLRPVKGVAPPPDGSRKIVPSEFIRENKDLLESAGVKGASVWHQNQLDSYGYWLTFDRHLSLRRLRLEAGFSEHSRPEEGWWRAFELFRKAGMIP